MNWTDPYRIRSHIPIAKLQNVGFDDDKSVFHEGSHLNTQPFDIGECSTMAT
jgi:hypothetical protein